MHGEHSTAGPLETRSAASATNASGADPGRGEAPRPKDTSSPQDVDALVSSFLDELDAISVTWGASVEPPRKEDVRPETPPEASREVPPPAPVPEAVSETPSPDSTQVPAEAPAPPVLPDADLQAAGLGAAEASAEPAPALTLPYIGAEPAPPEVAAEDVETAFPPVTSGAGPEAVDLEAAEMAGLALPPETALVADQAPAHLEPEVTAEVLDLQLAETLDELEREQLRVVPLTIHEKAGPADAGLGQAVAAEVPSALPAAEYLAGQAVSAASPVPPGVGEGEPAGMVPIPGHAGTREMSRDQAAGDATREGSPGLAATGVAPPPAAEEELGEDSSNVVPLPEHSGGDEPMTAEVVEDSLTEAAPEQASAAAQTRAAVLAKILSSKPVVAEKPKSSPDAESALRDIFQVKQTKRGAFKGVLSVALIVAALGLGYEIIKYLRSNPAWFHESNAPVPAPNEVATSPAGGAPADDMVQAVPIQKVIPPYPEAARSMGIAGEVEFEVDVDEKGNVTGVNPISGPQVFYEDAGQALRKWVFQPASRQGVPIHSTVRVTVEFKP